jgi:LmbE family N-acetylglucosaminyl deacetylase
VTTLVVSPHLDDAVLSCAHLLLARPQSVVATVMAGNPGPGVLSGWDRVCGFSDGDDPVARRREEDRCALRVVGASPRHLDFLDLPYREGRAGDDGGRVGAADITRHLAELVEELAPASVLIPLGLLHPDHVLTHQAGVLLRESHPQLTIWAYMDLPYGLAHPELMRSRLAGLEQAGVCTREVDVPTPPAAERKGLAVTCYESQVEPVMNDLGRDAWWGSFEEGSERFWELTVA